MNYVECLHLNRIGAIFNDESSNSMDFFADDPSNSASYVQHSV